MYSQSLSSPSEDRGGRPGLIGRIPPPAFPQGRCEMKIVLIGAGSADFGTGNLEALLRCEKLHGADLALVDIDQERLKLIEGLAARGNSEWGSAMTLSATTERRGGLGGGG